MIEKIKCRCWVCGGKNQRPLLTIAGVPLFCNVQYATPAAAQAAQTGTLELWYCTHCGHLYNHAFDAAAVAYAPEYENALHFSPRFQRFAEQLADQLIATYSLRGKHVVDVGCGQGDFLNLLCSRGGNTGTGYDPSYVPPEEPPTASLPYDVVQAYYGPAYADQRTDFLSCRHVLEHIERPVAFLSTIRQALDPQADTPVYFEVPNADYMFAQEAIWDLIYEHCNYFGEASLRQAFQRAGFKVDKIWPAFGDQYLCLTARPGAMDAPRQPPPAQPVPREVDRFQAAFEAKLAAWHAKVARLNAAKQRAVIWGAGSKGVTLSNLLDLKSVIPCIVDVNPRKQGRFVAGTGQEIISPAFLRSYQPEVVILTNPRYREEIKAELEAMDLYPALWRG